MSYGYYGFKPYVPVAQRRRDAEREMQKLRKKGHPVAPVIIGGRAIANTFWGKAWCENLERYSDFSNRLPRGRTYVRNGSVVDLQILPGEVAARVSGSSLYQVAVKVAPMAGRRWASLCKDCAAGIDSLVELLQGRFSKGVMERLCQERTGLFPTPAEIEFTCSCPDWASMCKHVAATLYGTGARLDEHPELLFKLRQVDEGELIAKAGAGLPLATQAPESSKVLATEDLSGLFGLELSPIAAEPTLAKPPGKKKATKARPKSKPRSKPTAAPTRLTTLLKAAERKTSASASSLPRRSKPARQARLTPSSANAPYCWPLPRHRGPRPASVGASRDPSHGWP